jgi:hypothetical protein
MECRCAPVVSRHRCDNAAVKSGRVISVFPLLEIGCSKNCMHERSSHLGIRTTTCVLVVRRYHDRLVLQHLRPSRWRPLTHVAVAPVHAITAPDFTAVSSICWLSNQCSPEEPVIIWVG